MVICGLGARRQRDLDDDLVVNPAERVHFCCFTMSGSVHDSMHNVLLSFCLLDWVIGMSMKAVPAYFHFVLSLDLLLLVLMLYICSPFHLFPHADYSDLREQKRVFIWKVEFTGKVTLNSKEAGQWPCCFRIVRVTNQWTNYC